MSETKKCDFCKSIIDNEATVCPVCLREQFSYTLEKTNLSQPKSNTNKNSKKTVIYITVALLVIIVTIFVFVFKEMDYRNRLDFAQKTYETELSNYTTCVSSNSNLDSLKLYFRCGYKPKKENVYR